MPFLGTSNYRPIADYGLLGDCHGAALVDSLGSIDWCCFHRFDSRPVFARLLDHDKGGYFSIAPEEKSESSRRYLDGTNVLATTFDTKSGRVELLDAMIVTTEPEPHHRLVRVVRGLAGSTPMSFHFHPRFDYGLSVPKLRLFDDTSGLVSGGADALLLQTEIELSQEGQCSCTATFEVTLGDEFVFSLLASESHEAEEKPFDKAAVLGFFEDTVSFWEEWSNRTTYEGPHRDHILRSALVLKALSNRPTGGMVAAPTTSLPEDVGGVRNWDYRYTWLRDSSFVVHAFYALGHEEEGRAFVGWLLRTTAGSAENMQVLYGVGGERILPEVDFDHLEGYEGSGPVRIGNGAVDQSQLDIFGEMIDTLHLLHKKGEEISDEAWEFCCSIADFVCEHWADPDDGLWEARMEPKHYVHSKVLCWAALDRAIKLAEGMKKDADIEGWTKTRDSIKAEVLERGFDDDRRTFVQRYDSDDLDAAALRLPLVSFISADDPLMVDTLRGVTERLGNKGYLNRYEGEDGLEGEEGAFLLCSFWQVDNLLMQGRVDEGRALLEHLLGCTNDLGLLSEQIDPKTADLLGNFPQAFSHMGLINSVLNLKQAEEEGACTTCRG